MTQKPARWSFTMGGLAAIWLTAFLFGGQLFAQTITVKGVVRDSTGAAIAGASVELKSGTFSATILTGSSGEFAFSDVPGSSGAFTVRANGFAEAHRNWNFSSGSLEIVLSPANVNEQVVVTATRTETRLSDVAGSAVVLDRQDLNTTPGLLVDDKLRQVPGFTLFRRSDSRTANPTSQGVSLNGLGASGASRALVLQDGVALNDPFGGWVYWGRIPQEELASVEVVRGGISSLYGSSALGGVIQFLSRQPEAPAFSLETSYGSERTPDLSFWTGTRHGPWDASLAADLFRTDGYVLVPVSQRGLVDTPANARHATVDLTLERHFGENTRVFGRGSFFTEARHNGTPIQTNDTQIAQGVLGADTRVGSSGQISLRAYGDAQSYDQNFSSIAANQMSESLTDRQHVPAEQMGGSAFWSDPVGRVQTLVAGVDAREVMGWSDESIFNSGTNLRDTVAGGRQRTVGVYGEDIVRLTPTWILTAEAREDHWRNFDAQSLLTPVSVPGPTVVTPFAERSENAFSPRLSLLHAVGSNLSLTASIYRAFRSPTLNELYRAFRMGNVLTTANSELRAERLTGAEAGANAFAFRRRLNLRGNFFWDDIVNPIANVTLSTTPTLITRQRQNLGRTRSRGVQLDAVARLSETLQISGGYEFVDATVVQFPANTALVGLRIPEVPRHQFTLQGSYSNPKRFTLSLQGRYSSSQFDDDQNTLLLGRYFTLDLLAGRSLGHGLEAFGAFENVLDQRYTVALTPTPNLGPPFLARIGLRFNYPRRD
jgi:outer membrane receptor protein involved in Fe transport